jgi:hypothetical protein
MRTSKSLVSAMTRGEAGDPAGCLQRAAPLACRGQRDRRLIPQGVQGNLAASGERALRIDADDSRLLGDQQRLQVRGRA